MRRLRLPRRPWTLRTRLLAALLALLAALSIVIGLVSVAALRTQLLGQVDRQLAAAGQRSSAAFEVPPPSQAPQSSGQNGPGPGFLSARGQAAGTLGAHLVAGRIVQVGVLDAAGSGRAVSAADGAVLTALPADGSVHTRSLPGLGDYRLIAVAKGGDVLITGLPLHDLSATVKRLAGVIVLVAVGGLLAAAAAGTAIIRVALRPLRRVTDTATRVSELPLDRGEVALRVRVEQSDTDTRSEVGQVGAAFNRMLGHVGRALEARQASEVKVRQFVADASHELRTPLASIRGYAEFTRRAAQDLPPDITHAMSRVESEATRMTGLVEDLLLLARLDTGRPAESEPVDLTALVIDAVSDAHAAGPQQPISLRLPDEPVTVPGEAGRLHQVLTNLLANARTHTPPGTAITVELASRGDAAVLVVTDDGPGIPPDLLPTVFERFARGDSSRSRAAGSTGLGLAIVAAVVHAHGGQVDVDSRPGHTAFSVRLPTVARSQHTLEPSTAAT